MLKNGSQLCAIQFSRFLYLIKLFAICHCKFVEEYCRKFYWLGLLTFVTVRVKSSVAVKVDQTEVDEKIADLDIV